ncbi:ferric enterobactin receptor [gamma proteobacterium BDW918]|uniref:Uncharacterized protein n=1 Tax=Zhongshania aliphaticivorans TaxID=1470434 RepID=A0A127M8Y1_9GAMM|nr:hypothetical protein [Zhongshania aliphaticivorans]AMO69638.1 hypothetical protein AZF00_15625 [Zhongshania aliphaticivorans]EIF42301.1 ferric enterobactin receptor [gamma proteobacterium BDW918]
MPQVLVSELRLCSSSTFNNISTQFVTDGSGGLTAQERGTFRYDSTVAKAIGIPKLKEEESVNLSYGVVLEPVDALSISK